MQSQTLFVLLALCSLCLFRSALANIEVKEGQVACYQCDQCNSVNIIDTKVVAGNYCKKSVFLGETSRSAVDSCTPIPKTVYCCQAQLCNAARPAAGTSTVLGSLAAAAVSIAFMLF